MLIAHHHEVCNRQELFSSLDGWKVCNHQDLFPTPFGGQKLIHINISLAIKRPRFLRTAERGGGKTREIDAPVKCLCRLTLRFPPISLARPHVRRLPAAGVRDLAMLCSRPIVWTVCFNLLRRYACADETNLTGLFNGVLKVSVSSVERMMFTNLLHVGIGLSFILRRRRSLALYAETIHAIFMLSAYYVPICAVRDTHAPIHY